MAYSRFPNYAGIIRLSPSTDMVVKSTAKSSLFTQQQTTKIQLAQLARLDWTCGSTSVNCESPQSVNDVCGRKQDGQLQLSQLSCPVILSDQKIQLRLYKGEISFEIVRYGPQWLIRALHVLILMTVCACSASKYTDLSMILRK